MSAYNFGGSGPTLTKLYKGTWLEAGVIKWTLILQGVPTFDFDRVYLRNPERIVISKIGKVLYQLYFILYWRK